MPEQPDPRPHPRPHPRPQHHQAIDQLTAHTIPDPRTDLAVWSGVHTIETTEDGWSTFWRVDPTARALVPDPRFWEVARIPAGVAARWLAHARAMTIELRGSAESSTADLLVDGATYRRIAVTPTGGTHRIDLPDRQVTVELWLPHSGHTQLRGVAFIEGTATPDPANRPHWIAYGSSITQCASADGPSETWPALIAREHGLRLTCLGLGGQCHIDPVIARGIRDTPAELISLCLGINMYNRATFSARTLRPQVTGFLQTIRDGHPETPVVVITPIASPAREDVANAAGHTLRDVRREIAAAVAVLRELGDDRLHVIDGRSVLTVEEAAKYLHDGLHPTAAGYHLMAKRLAAPLMSSAAPQ
jgi:GDSL-like Lipase/Acylhydrolase family